MKTNKNKNPYADYIKMMKKASVIRIGNKNDVCYISDGYSAVKMPISSYNEYFYGSKEGENFFPSLNNNGNMFQKVEGKNFSSIADDKWINTIENKFIEIAKTNEIKFYPVYYQTTAEIECYISYVNGNWGLFNRKIVDATLPIDIPMSGGQTSIRPVGCLTSDFNNHIGMHGWLVMPINVDSIAMNRLEKYLNKVEY